jgi:rare lipoprotein A
LSRAAFALLCFALALTLSACGGHKKSTRVRVPAPPTISQPTDTTDQGEIGEKTAPGLPTSEDEYKGQKPVYVETGIASWYGPPYHNRRGSNGEIFDMNGLTAAHRTLPLNSIARVTNLDTGKSAIVRITDRGPFIEGRMLDLSVAAAKAVDVWRPGLAEVKLEVMHTPLPIDKGGRWCVQIGAFQSVKTATRLKERLARKYETAKVLEFSGPTGEWVRVRVWNDDKRRAEEVADSTVTSEGSVFLVRLD